MSIEDSGQLNGWKEIAAYIGKGVRQAQRWEKLGMPVERVGGMDGVVYAYRDQIDEWRRSAAGQTADRPSQSGSMSEGGTIAPSSEPNGPAIERPSSLIGRNVLWIAATAGVALIAVGFGGYRLFTSPPMDVVLSSPSQADQGGSFRFSASGAGPDLRSAYRMMRNPRGGEHLVAPPVPRDADGRFVWVFSTDCQTPPGRHEMALADSGGRLLTAVVAVTVNENPVCQGPVPDLVADSITITEDLVGIGGSIRCRFRLTNQGARAANPSTTRLRLSKSPMRSSVSDARLGDVAAPALKPGEQAIFEPLVTLPGLVEAGVYYVWVVADNNSDNVESFTHNNYARSAALVVAGRR